MKTLSILLLSCLVTLAGYSQTIKGAVTSEEGQPVSNATVTLKNTFLGTVSGSDGTFILKTGSAGNYMLVVQSIGFEAVEQPVTIAAGEEVNVSVQLKKAVGSLKEVTITASRKAEIVDRTPAAVQVINARDIQTQMLISPNISNILAQAAPSIAFGTNTTSNVGQTLRGRTPLILVDGIPQSTPLRAGGRDIRTIDPAAIERVEVVKGATAIYGNGADGGIINYITKKAAGSKPFSASTYIANTGMPVHSGGTLGGRLTQQFNGTVNKFDYIVSGTYEKTGVFKSADGIALSPVYGTGESNIYNAFTKLGYNINSQHRVEAMYNYYGSAQQTESIEKTGVYQTTPTIGIKGTHMGEEEGTRYNHNAYVKYGAKELPLQTSLEASAYLQSFYTIYGFTSFFENGGQSTVQSDKKGLRLNLNTPYTVSNWFKGDVVYGVDVLSDVTAQILVDGRTWVPKIDMNNTAPYLQANAVLFGDWLLKAGYRFDHVNIDIPTFTQVKDSRGNGGQLINGGALAFDASTFNTGLRFARFEWFKPFVSYTQGFSIIDIGRYVRSAKENDIARMQIQPVKVNNYEVGFNSSHLLFDVTGSYFISTNKIGASLIEENGLYVQQKAPEKTYGYEASVDVRPLSFLHAGASYMYVEGKADLNKNNRFDDAADMYLNGTKISPPKTAAYIKVLPTKDINLYLQWLHYGDRQRFNRRSTTGLYAFGEGPVEGEGVVNFSGAWQVTNRVQLSMGIENLLNKDYFTPIAQWSAQNADYIKANGMRYQLGVGIKW